MQTVAGLAVGSGLNELSNCRASWRALTSYVAGWVSIHKAAGCRLYVEAASCRFRRMAASVRGMASKFRHQRDVFMATTNFVVTVHRVFELLVALRAILDE